MALASGTPMSIASCNQRPNSASGSSVNSACVNPPRRNSRRIACKSMFFPYDAARSKNLATLAASVSIVRLLADEVTVFPDLLSDRATWINKRPWTMLVIGEEFTDVFLTVWPAVSSPPLVEVIHEFAGVVFDILRQPVLRIFILSPVFYAEEIGAAPFALVI